jgi:hypothetical protein
MLLLSVWTGVDAEAADTHSDGFLGFTQALMAFEDIEAGTARLIFGEDAAAESTRRARIDAARAFAATALHRLTCHCQSRIRQHGCPTHARAGLRCHQKATSTNPPQPGKVSCQFMGERGK